ncbi:MAG TPA: glycosyl transferase, partial [Candidatus Eisenbacteria bacterium]|nr:glycosyl transferase [Candidatus Eisenbacteria bacterium]
PARATHAFTADRAAFLGPPGSARAPAALESRAPLDGRTGEVEHPCFAQQVSFALPAGGDVEVLFVLGAGDVTVARRIARELAGASAAARSLDRVRRYWGGLCSRLRVSTPEPALDPLLEGWLLYQTIACRLWGRTAFYQSGGALGFRDQLQDALALLPFAPELVRAQLLLHARHQFVEGDVLHWWHPPAGRGLRTRFADDLAWLPWAVAEYVAFTGDRAVLAEPVPYRAARALEPGEDEAFLDTRETSPVESLYEHAARALDRALTRGVHDLPLFGTGDWNDGMNRVGREGRGESVWMGFFLVDVIRRFTPLADHAGDTARAARWREADARLVAALETHGWDGAWYRRGWYDDGAPLGSSDSDECRIDALVQAWSVLSGAAPRARAEAAMDAVERRLVSERDELIRLLTPAFDRTPHDPGYIKGYVRGVRENGGQYTHAALWVVRALAQLGRRERAARLLAMLSPIAHSSTPGRRDVYGLEPYVVAADVYGEPPHVRRGGWSWYTGSAGWMLRVALESVLGVTVEDGALCVRPCIPDAWSGYSLAWRIPGSESVVELEVLNPARCSARVVAAELDGQPLEVADGVQVPLPSDGRAHALRVTLGA